MKQRLICMISVFMFFACSCAAADSEPFTQSSDTSTATEMSGSDPSTQSSNTSAAAEMSGSVDSTIENSDSDLSSSAPDIQKTPDNLGDWLKENLWNIIGNINLINTPEVCEYVNPRSAQLYIADIDNDGSLELIHSLFTGSYTTINSVYKPNNNELDFYGYYYSNAGIWDNSELTDGVYTNGNNRRYLCSRPVTSGSFSQPVWIQIYEMKFGSGIELVPIISGEWAPQEYGAEYHLVKAGYDGGIIYNDNEYDQWVSELLSGYTRTGDIADIVDGMNVPFSIGAKDITSDEELQSIINWICDGLTAKD